eukprot:gene6277-6998_t
MRIKALFLTTEERVIQDCGSISWGLEIEDRLNLGTKRDGMRLYNESGIITTPGYPNPYPTSMAFIWLINTTQSKYIELTFLDFDVEAYANCAADYVKIRNKKSHTRNFQDVPQIDLTTTTSAIKLSTKGPFCNSNRPPKVVTSSSNLMAIVFLADSSESYRGFKASYRSLERKACSIVKTNPSGTIMTPGYPLHYPNEGECIWTIRVRSGKYIRLEFIAFDLDFNTQLCMDEIFIWDGDSTSARTLARGCRLSPKVIYSSTNRLRIRFTSQGYHRSKGFKALYTTTSTKGCGGDFQLPNGTFESPSFNLLASYTYPPYSNCLWTIEAPRGHVLSLRFTFFDVLPGATGRCDEDYVDVYDGPVKSAGRYCNANKPTVLASTGRFIYMRFTSNHKGHGKGFRVQFQRHSTACDQPLGIADGRISDNRISSSSYLKGSLHLRPRFARLNGLNAWCSQIQVNSRVGEYLQIDFKDYTKVTGFATQGYVMSGQKYYLTKYKVEYSNNFGAYFTRYKNPMDRDTTSDYTVFSGGMEFKRNDLKHPIIAKMFRIYPLGYVHGKKRVMCLKTEIYGCKFDFGDGKLLQKLNDNFMYTAATASSAKSSRWIISPFNIYRNAVIYVMPMFFDIDCSKALLVISDAAGNNHTYCGKKRPPPFQVFSAAGQLLVTFEKKTGQGQGGKGARGQRFGLQYFTENLGSGGLLRSRRGTVRSARHVAERVSNRTSSTWIIVQPKRERIVARFKTLRLGMSNSGQCDEYVEIKDGLLESSPSYGKFCIGVPQKPVISSGNYLRVVLHTRKNTTRFRREMQPSRIIFEIDYTTLDNNRRDGNGQQDETKLEQNEDGFRTTTVNASKAHCHRELNTILVLVITLLLLLWI